MAYGKNTGDSVFVLDIESFKRLDRIATALERTEKHMEEPKVRPMTDDEKKYWQTVLHTSEKKAGA